MDRVIIGTPSTSGRPHIGCDTPMGLLKLLTPGNFFVPHVGPTWVVSLQSPGIIGDVEGDSRPKEYFLFVSGIT
jgi:hypothetical protein